MKWDCTHWCKISGDPAQILQRIQILRDQICVVRVCCSADRPSSSVVRFIIISRKLINRLRLRRSPFLRFLHEFLKIYEVPAGVSKQPPVWVMNCKCLTFIEYEEIIPSYSRLDALRETFFRQIFVWEIKLSHFVYCIKFMADVPPSNLPRPRGNERLFNSGCGEVDSSQS